MSEKVILNPVQRGFDADLQDNMNPNYGFTRKRPLTQLNKKAVGGVPYFREFQNSGHSFPLTWLTRSWRCIQRLKWFHEQFEDGYFTIIDWDGGGRHYVGHFTSEVNEVHIGNNQWNAANVMFEEIPTVPMLQYPSDWDRDAVLLNLYNDYGDQKLAVGSSVVGAWAQTASQGFDGATGDAVNNITLDNLTPTAGDWAQYEYRGYGFRLYLRKGPAFGQCQVYVDGVLNCTLDCYAPALLPMMMLEVHKLPLDYHRVQVVCLNTKNAAATASGISWSHLQVMR